MLILDWNSHAPGPGEETGLGSLSVPGAVGVCSVRNHGLGLRQFYGFQRLNLLLYVSQMIYDGH